MSSNLEQLYNAKFQKIKQQQTVSKKMHDLLSKQGGLNDNSTLKMKNLQAAIAVSKQPGYFEYYHSSDDVKHVEEKKVLSYLAREIAKYNAELEQLNSEIEQAEHQNKLQHKEPPAVNDLRQWFELYGRPTMTEEKRERLTGFTKSSRMYGGNKHFNSFKSASTIMIKGKVTR